jgi:release factor glutamine methyltransferase
MKVGRILESASAQVDKIDAELLLTCVLNVGRATLKAFPERELSVEQKNKFKELLDRRIKGEPVAYLLGHKEFWSLDFIVTPDVLIPRSDTELLVEMALEQIPAKKTMRILDLGAGCGAIALSIAADRPKVTVVATDVSAEALQISKLNAKHLHITNVEFALGNWFEALTNITDQRFDIIVSNPPYVAHFDPHLEQGDLRYEPNKALVSGSEGMDDLRIIISQARGYLVPGGTLMVEHGYDQEALVAAEFAKAGFENIECYKDLAGIPRVTVGFTRLSV